MWWYFWQIIHKFFHVLQTCQARPAVVSMQVNQQCSGWRLRLASCKGLLHKAGPCRHLHMVSPNQKWEGNKHLDSMLFFLDWTNWKFKELYHLPKCLLELNLDTPRIAPLTPVPAWVPGHRSEHGRGVANFVSPVTAPGGRRSKIGVGITCGAEDRIKIYNYPN